MKKLIFIALIALTLCGCNNTPKLINNASDKDHDTIINTEYEKYNNIFKKNYSDGEEITDNTDKQIELVKSLPLLNINIKQAGQNPEIVNIYKSENPYFLIADTSYARKNSDITYTEFYGGSQTTSKKYSDIISAFKEKNWELNYCLTGGGIDKLTFSNDEYTIANYKYGMFCLSYDNVQLNSDNIPLAITLYMNEGKISSVYINYYLLSNQKKQLSIKDINMLRDGLELANITDFDIIINNLQEQLSSYKKLKSDFQHYTLKSVKPVILNKNETLGTFIIDIK